MQAEGRRRIAVCDHHGARGQRARHYNPPMQLPGEGGAVKDVGEDGGIMSLLWNAGDLLKPRAGTIGTTPWKLALVGWCLGSFR